MTIHFKTIKYRNFLSTGNVDTIISLDQHKNTLIIGENGSGKSTVLEAISYALYGKPMRNVNKPQLINSIVGRGLLVEIEFSIGSKEYRVCRGMKPNILEIYVDDRLLNQDSAVRDYQDILETQILKLNHKSFSQIVVLSISNYVPFMKLPAAGRREVIEDLLDIQIFSVMNILLKERIAQNKTDLQSNEYDIRLIENKIDMNKKHMDEINQNNRTVIKKHKEKIKEYSNEAASISKLIKTYETEILCLNEKIDNRKQTQTKLEKLLFNQQTIMDKRKTIISAIEFYQTNAVCPTCKQELDNEYKADVIDKKTTVLREAEKASRIIEAKVSLLQSDIADLPTLRERMRELNNFITENNAKIRGNIRFINSLRNEIQEIEEKIRKAKEDNSVYRELADELNSAVHKRENLINDREVYSMASQLLKDGGIKTRIIRQYIPIMNKLINKYLAQMEFFVQFELDETFRETIKSRFRDEFTYDSFSQGEKLRIDLSLLFCWRAIAKLRNSSSSNLLFMDEILDSSLDAGGVEEFLKIINDLTSETNTFIISHRGDSMIDKFDHTILFQKIKNFSRIAA